MMPHIYPEDCSSPCACGRTWGDGSCPFHQWEFVLCLRSASRKGLTHLLGAPSAWGVEFLAAVFSGKPSWFSDILDLGCCDTCIKGVRYLTLTSSVQDAHIQYSRRICPDYSRSYCWWDPPQLSVLCGTLPGWWLHAQLCIAGGLAGDDMVPATKRSSYPVV